MSAEIIQFIRGPNQYRVPSDFPAIAFRLVARPDDLVMDHADMPACDYVRAGGLPPLERG